MANKVPDFYFILVFSDILPDFNIFSADVFLFVYSVIKYYKNIVLFIPSKFSIIKKLSLTQDPELSTVTIFLTFFQQFTKKGIV